MFSIVYVVNYGGSGLVTFKWEDNFYIVVSGNTCS